MSLLFSDIQALAATRVQELRAVSEKATKSDDRNNHKFAAHQLESYMRLSDSQSRQAFVHDQLTQLKLTTANSKRAIALNLVIKEITAFHTMITGGTDVVAPPAEPRSNLAGDVEYSHRRPISISSTRPPGQKKTHSAWRMR